MRLVFGVGGISLLHMAITYHNQHTDDYYAQYELWLVQVEYEDAMGDFDDDDWTDEDEEEYQRDLMR